MIKHTKINSFTKSSLTIASALILQACSNLQQDLQWIATEPDQNLDLALSICEAKAEQDTQAIKLKYAELGAKEKSACEQGKQKNENNVTVYGDAIIVEGKGIQPIQPDYTVCGYSGTSIAGAVAASKQRKLSLKACMAEKGFYQN